LKSDSVSRLFLWSCYGAMIGIAAAVNVTPVCLSSISESFSLDYSQQGLLLGCTFWGFIISLLIVAPLTDYLGPRRFFYSATILQCAAFLLFATASRSWMLAIGALLGGIGAGILEAILTPVICESFPDRRTSATNLLHAFYALGAAAVILISRTILGFSDGAAAEQAATFINQESETWRWAYVVMILIPAVYGFGFWVCFRVQRIGISYPHSDSLTGTLGRLWRWGFVLFLAGIICGAGTELGAAQWIPSYLENVTVWTREDSAMGLLILSLTMGIGRILAGRIGDYLSSVGMLILAGSVCAGCLVVAGSAASGMVIVFAFGLMGFFVGWMWPTIMALASETFPGTGASMFALLAIAGNAAGIIFPGVVGFTAEQLGLRFAMTSLAAVPCALVVLFLMWRLRTEPSMPASTERDTHATGIDSPPDHQ